MLKGVMKLAAAAVFAALAVCAPAYSAQAQTVTSGSDAVVSSADTIGLIPAGGESVTSGADAVETAASESDAAPGKEASSVQDDSLQLIIPDNIAPEEDAQAPAEIPGEGWQTVDGVSRYFVGGIAQTGAVTVDGLTYYVGDGVFEPVNGWKEMGGKRYFFADGIAVTGRSTVDGRIYFFAEDGALCEYDGWCELYDERTGASERYYFVDGAASAGLVDIDGDIFYFDEQGRLTSYNGWKTIWNDLMECEATCYFSDGCVLTGVQTIGSEKYFFTDTGVLAENSWYNTDDGRYYVVDGKAQTGFVRASGSIYYLGEDGIFDACSGWKTIDGGRYLLSGGVVLTGLILSDEAWYYLDEDYNGRMIRGFITSDNGVYYAGSDGQLCSGLLSISGKTYYFGADHAAVSGWQTVGSSKYYFGSEGYALTGWFQSNGSYYYGGADGAILTNCTVDGYELDEEGRRQFSSELAAKVNEVITSCTNDSMSAIEKLKACYKWVIDNCSYKRDYADPDKLASGWAEKYALEMISGKKGNCYRYASAVAGFAEGLGYDASVVTGKIVAVGGGMTPHGWAEVKINGATYIFDANMDDSKGKFICFQKTYGNFPYRITKGKTYEINL